MRGICTGMYERDIAILYRHVWEGYCYTVHSVTQNCSVNFSDFGFSTKISKLVGGVFGVSRIVIPQKIFLAKIVVS